MQMTWTRPALVGLAWLFMLFVAIQFFFGGMLAFSGFADGLDEHRIIGYPILSTIPILMIVVAVIGKLEKKIIGMTVGLFVLVVIQPQWASIDTDKTWIHAIHVPFALAIAFLGYHLAKAATVAYKGEKAA
jgi:hypothetical protein